MRIDIVTLFPGMFTGPLSESIVQRAVNKALVSIHLHQLRDFASDKHGTVDDTPYGGGAGMVLKVDVIGRAIDFVRVEGKKELTSLKPHIILLTPQGKTLTQPLARDLSKQHWLILIAGHYEGFDERVRDLVDEEVSLGDFVLTGGELSAMVLADVVIRLVPGVLGKEESHQSESHEQGLLEYPQYTRPEEFHGMKVPEILKSGNHAEIEKWRQEQSIKRTKERRPDLLESRISPNC